METGVAACCSGLGAVRDGGGGALGDRPRDLRTTTLRRSEREGLGRAGAGDGACAELATQAFRTGEPDDVETGVAARGSGLGAVRDGGAFGDRPRDLRTTTLRRSEREDLGRAGAGDGSSCDDASRCVCFLSANRGRGQRCGRFVVPPRVERHADPYRLVTGGWLRFARPVVVLAWSVGAGTARVGDALRRSVGGLATSSSTDETAGGGA